MSRQRIGLGRRIGFDQIGPTNERGSQFLSRGWSVITGRNCTRTEERKDDRNRGNDIATCQHGGVTLRVESGSVN